MVQDRPAANHFPASFGCEKAGAKPSFLAGEEPGDRKLTTLTTLGYFLSYMWVHRDCDMVTLCLNISQGLHVVGFHPISKLTLYVFRSDGFLGHVALTDALFFQSSARVRAGTAIVGCGTRCHPWTLAWSPVNRTSWLQMKEELLKFDMHPCAKQLVKVSFCFIFVFTAVCFFPSFCRSFAVPQPWCTYMYGICVHHRYNIDINI